MMSIIHSHSPRLLITPEPTDAERRAIEAALSDVLDQREAARPSPWSEQSILDACQVTQ